MPVRSVSWDISDATLLDYYMAQAPAEPQPWFIPIVPPRPEPVWLGESGTTYPSASEAGRAEGDCFEMANAAEVDAWEGAYRKQRYVQWPMAWALAVLKHREAMCL